MNIKWLLVDKNGIKPFVVKVNLQHIFIFSGQPDCLHCVKIENFPYNEDFVKVNSSQGLSPYNALLKTCIYYCHTVNECLVVQFQGSSKHVF